MTESNDVDDRLQRLRAATASLAARPGFVDQVMARIAEVEVAWWQLLATPARWVLPAAAVLAVVVGGWAYQARTRLDESLAISFGAESYSALEDEP